MLFLPAWLIYVLPIAANLICLLAAAINARQFWQEWRHRHDDWRAAPALTNTAAQAGEEPASSASPKRTR